MATSAKVLPPIIQDEMQKRRMMKKSTTIPKFQTRLFVLKKDKLSYKTKDGKQTRGSISVMGIKICEDVEECAFNKPHVFQVGYLEKGKMFHLYIQAKDHDMREIWKFHIRKLCTAYNDQRMQTRYHAGHFKKDKWTCCANGDKNNIGCRQAYLYDGPQPLGDAERRPTVFLPSDYLANSNRGSQSRYSLPVLQLDTLDGSSPRDSPTAGPKFGFEHKTYEFRRAISEEQSGAGKSWTISGSSSDDGTGKQRHLSVSDFRTPYFGKSDNTYLVIRKSFDRKSSIGEIEEEGEIATEEDRISGTDSISGSDSISANSTTLSSQSMRYTTRPLPGKLSRPVSEISNSSGSDVGCGIAMSTPNFCPISIKSDPTQDVRKVRPSTSLYSSASVIPTTTSEKFDLLSSSDIAGSERFDSLGAMSHTSRLDSQGSTICSSVCESMSIPRTESDYQRRIEEEGEGGGGTGPVYTSSTMSASGTEEGSFTRADSLSSTLEFEMDLHDPLDRTGSTKSGVYVNTHGRYT